MAGVVTRAARKGDPQPTRMLEIPMASFSTTIDEARPFEIGNELADLPWHTQSSITMILDIKRES